MLYIFAGPDDYSISEALKELKMGLGDPELLQSNTSTLDGKSVSLDELRLTSQAAPFLAEKRLVVVEGLLERLSPPKEGSRNRKSPGGKPAPGRQNEIKTMTDIINGLPETTVLVLVEKEIKTGPACKELVSRAKVRTFPVLKMPDLGGWITKKVAGLGGSISPAAVELLARLVGGNLWVMSGEVDKLVLYASGRRIEEDDVKAIVGYSREATVFEMIDAILESRSAAGQRALQQLIKAGEAPAFILFMLARQVRLLIITRAMLKDGRKEIEIQDRLGISADFVWRKTLDQAGRHSLERLKNLYRRILDADMAIKTGKYGDELALQILVAEMGEK